MRIGKERASRKNPGSSFLFTGSISKFKGQNNDLNTVLHSLSLDQRIFITDAVFHLAVHTAAKLHTGCVSI
jgi:hypothetical protein